MTPPLPWLRLALFRVARAAAVLVVCLSGAPGCGSMQKAAAQDPMRCERDPSCSKGRDNYADCTKQCVDDPECTDRCRMMQSDRVGAP
jgi:hypothetical protein